MMKGKTVIIFAVVTLLIVGAFYWTGGATSAVNAETTSQERLIRVYGEAELNASPDRAYIGLGVETQSETAEKAVEENARLMSEVISALQKMGLDKEQLETGSYQLHSYKEYVEPVRDKREEYTIVYRASNRLNITVKDLEDTGKIIDTAVKAGANQIQSLRFDLNNSENLKMEALKEATKQARAKATAVAGGAGVSIKGIKSISEEMASYSPYRAVMMEDARGADMAPTPVLPGDVKVQARVVVEYFF